MALAQRQERPCAIRQEMQRHRSATTTPKPYTVSELDKLAGGVCEDMKDCTPRSERIAKRVIKVCGVGVLIGMVLKAMGVL